MRRFNMITYLIPRNEICVSEMASRRTGKVGSHDWNLEHVWILIIVNKMVHLTQLCVKKNLI